MLVIPLRGSRRESEGYTGGHERDHARIKTDSNQSQESRPVTIYFCQYNLVKDTEQLWLLKADTRSNNLPCWQNWGNATH